MLRLSPSDQSDSSTDPQPTGGSVAGRSTSPAPLNSPASPSSPVKPGPAAVPARPGRVGGPSAAEQLKGLGATGFLLVAWGVLPPLCSIPLYKFMPQMSVWLTTSGHLGLFVFIGGFILFAGMGVLPTYAQAALAGFAFGVPLGLAASVVGFTGASLVGYTIVRSISGDHVEKLIQQNRKASAVRELLVGSGSSSFSRTLWMVTLLRLPNTPFAWFNLVMASVKVPLVPFVLGTMIGMLPRTALIVTVGHLVQGVLSEDALEKSSPKGLMWAGIKLSILLLMLISETLARQVDRIFRESPRRAAAEASPAQVS